MEKLIDTELQKANAVYPQFNSRHEAYAVLLEEVEEVEAEFIILKETLATLWKEIKDDLPKEDILFRLNDLEHVGYMLLREHIQVMAMIKKSFTHVRGE